MEINTCAEGISHAIMDENLKQHLQKYLQNHDYGNAAEIEKIYNLL
jgi:hypothetical protein